jgi:hypothetical protein
MMVGSHVDFIFSKKTPLLSVYLSPILQCFIVKFFFFLTKGAFDTLEWSFLLKVLSSFGFNDTFCNLI